MSTSVAGRIGPDGPPEPPEHLSPEAARRWQSVTGTWVLSATELLLLEEALAAWDRVQECREILAREGPVTVNPDSGNPKRHPAAQELDQSLTQLRNCLRQLDLPEDG